MLRSLSDPAARARPTGGDPAEIADSLQSWWAARDDTSFDPYDGLAATRVPGLLTKARTSRLALVHAHKRAPVNLRRAFGIPPTKSPYAVGLFASAGLRLHRLGASASAERHSGTRLAWLQATRIRGGWAYPFDVQTRTLSYSRTTPNVVCTAFAAQAFLDAVEFGAPEHLDIADEAVGFLLRELLTTTADGTYFRYLPRESALIHNANALAVACVVRFGTLAGRPDLVRIGLNALRTTLGDIREDGSLPYGRGTRLTWVDGHHTGFVLQALAEVARYTADAGATLAPSIAAMAGFYRRHLFGPDGWPYQRPGSPYPVDVIAGAEGIRSFATLGGEYLPIAKAIASFMDRQMRLSSGGYVFLRCRHHTKAIPYARWSDAPMCLALAVLASSQRDQAMR